MAKSDSFHCSVITPERSVLDCEATFVSFPAHDGEMGVLKNRAPLVCKLGIGTLRVEATEGTQLLFMDGGFAQMLENRLTILTSQARFAKELNAASAERALGEAQAMTVRDDATLKAKSTAEQRARAQLRLIHRGAQAH